MHDRQRRDLLRALFWLVCLLPTAAVDWILGHAAAAGIAITAAYVANGSWYYSLNNGTSWNPMGIPSNTLSRLLAADAGTRVYFQPSPGFSNAR